MNLENFELKCEIKLTKEISIGYVHTCNKKSTVLT